MEILGRRTKGDVGSSVETLATVLQQAFVTQKGPGVNCSGLPANALCYQTLITVLYLTINLSIKYYLVVSN